MTLALLALVAVLMAGDIFTTLRGLRGGCGESNLVAMAILHRLGPVAGLIAFQAFWFASLSIFLWLRPDQWGAAALMGAASATGIINNLYALRRSSKG